MSWRAAIATALLVATTATPAGAHSSDPNVFTRIDAVTPDLPGVTIEVRAGVADQLLVVNTTSTVVEVLDATGRPFLRIGSTSVEANYASADWYTSNSPLGLAQRPPKTTKDDWRVVSRGGSWGWFDHRLHDRARPLTPELKAARSVVRLADWTIPLRYGGTPVTVRGHVEYRPVLGAFRTKAEQVPRGVTVDVLDGRVPGLFLGWQGRGTLVVQGVDGEPFARFSAREVQVNEASATWQEDQRLRGNAIAATTTTSWRAQGTAPRLTWLDRRLAYAPGVAPDSVLHARHDTTVVEWSIPVTVDGRADAIRGTTVWHPTEPPARTTNPWPYVAVGVVVIGGLLVVRKRVTRG
jgi:hypothetical protein